MFPHTFPVLHLMFCGLLDGIRKYLQAYQDHRAAFTPLCASVDGLLEKEADFHPSIT